MCQPVCDSRVPVSLGPGLLSRVVPLRRKLADAGDGAPLKLLIMSATLRLEDFADNRRRAQPAPEGAEAALWKLHLAMLQPHLLSCSRSGNRNSAGRGQSHVHVVSFSMQIKRGNFVQAVS